MMGLEYMGEYYRNYAQVNLNHIRNNLELVRATIKKGCKLMVVLKANAYGHGIEQCAIACRNADMFAVATLQEALMIRRTGLRTPVLLLGPVDPNPLELPIVRTAIPAFTPPAPRQADGPSPAPAITGIPLTRPICFADASVSLPTPAVEGTISGRILSGK